MKYKYIGESGRFSRGDIVDLDVREVFSVKTHDLLNVFATVHGTRESESYSDWDGFNSDWEPVDDSVPMLP